MLPQKHRAVADHKKRLPQRLIPKLIVDTSEIRLVALAGIMSEVSVLVFPTFMCTSMLLTDINVKFNEKIIAKASVTVTDTPHSLFCGCAFNGP